MITFNAWACTKAFVHQDNRAEPLTDHMFDHTGHELQTRFFEGQVMLMEQSKTPPGPKKNWKRVSFAFGCQEIKPTPKPTKGKSLRKF